MKHTQMRTKQKSLQKTNLLDLFRVELKAEGLVHLVCGRDLGALERDLADRLGVGVLEVVEHVVLEAEPALLPVAHHVAALVQKPLLLGVGPRQACTGRLAHPAALCFLRTKNDEKKGAVSR